MPRLSTPVISSRSVVIRLLSAMAALFLALAFAAVFPRDAYACSCNGRTSQSAARQADAIFAGRVLATSTVRRPKPGRTEIRFEVSQVYKGSVYREQVVASPQGGDGCGIAPAVNSDWVIFAEERVEGSGNSAVFRLVTQLCSGNLPGSLPPTTLGRGQPPMDGASDREERAVTTDAAFTRTLEIGGITLGVLVVLGGVGLAYLWRPGRRDS